nr:MAG: hypothetical protein [brine shrimp yue-like virus 6]
MSELSPVREGDDGRVTPTTGDPGVGGRVPVEENVQNTLPRKNLFTDSDSPSTAESNPKYDSDQEAFERREAERAERRKERREEKRAAKEEKKRLLAAAKPGGSQAEGVPPTRRPNVGSEFSEHVKEIEEKRKRDQIVNIKPTGQPPRETFGQLPREPFGQALDFSFGNFFESKIDDDKYRKYEEYFSSSEVGGVPHLLDATITTDVNAMLTGWGADTDTKGSVLIAFVIAAARFECLELPVEGNIKGPMKYKYTAKDSTEVEASEDALGAVPNDAKGQWFKTTVMSLRRAKTWVIELSACHQIKVLKASNIENYFRSLYDTPCSAGTVLNVVKAVAARFDPIMKDPRLRKYVNNSAFIDYHTTAASSARLIKRFIEENPVLLPYFLKEGEQEFIEEALKYSWSVELQQQIPIELIAVAKAYLQANDIIINNWYQGNKATNAVPAVRYNQWVKFFKKWVSLNSNDSAIEKSTTPEELLLRAPRGMFRTLPIE